jgi:exonuclease SbcC
LRRLEHERDVVGKAVEGKAAAVGQFREAAALANSHVALILAELENLDARINAVTAHPDPAAESADLATKAGEIESRLDGARAALAEAQTKLATADAVAAAAAEQAAGAAGEAAGLIRRAEAAVRAAGFASAREAKDAIIEPATMAGLRKSVQDYRVDQEATDRRISVLERELGGREASEAALNAAAAELEAVSRERDAAVGAVATLNAQIQRTRDRMEQGKQLAAEHGRCKAERGVYRQLAEELRTDRFQEFVLEEAFHDLARGASERLKDLSGRYALQYADGDILVVDHDNANETRSADTLSGGETFLVSLSLALELSEQIQQAAGAVLLESLFIDEGFGTLDVETLDSATSAIESLRGRGRMVGIITHIRDLADRLPCRIEVDWRSEGSRVAVSHS